MDLGLWATWFDLEMSDREPFLDWAHRTYLPFLRTMPGVSWVAQYANEGGGPRMDELAANVIGRTDEDIGNGSQFVTLVGAASPHTFFDPYIPDITWPEGFEEMLALRKGKRSAIFSEAYRVAGPDGETLTIGGPPGPYIQMGSFRMSDIETDFQIGKWYAQYRLPYMAGMPGAIRTRKYVGVAGWAKHAILYEFTSAEARMENFEVKHEAHDLQSQDWQMAILRKTVHSPGSPTIGPRIWPPAD